MPPGSPPPPYSQEDSAYGSQQPPYNEPPARSSPYLDLMPLIEAAVATPASLIRAITPPTLRRASVVDLTNAEGEDVVSEEPEEENGQQPERETPSPLNRRERRDRRRVARRVLRAERRRELAIQVANEVRLGDARAREGELQAIRAQLAESNQDEGGREEERGLPYKLRACQYHCQPFNASLQRPLRLAAVLAMLVYMGRLYVVN
ncbi:hypothetical protein CC80DRAFT_552357 [Byssothecium circinans]|uniref:Uncharacterized protein n=1 Tax=Byssothecium circinans TaxID=147558 RepID=A0A6A5TP20_9PLEO|nr:hypothetical protein CC80DRAFT_552357 [Byssothecium circinans]